MPNYLLPCPCGKKTAVSTAQAGDTIHCDCGAELLVPTMRALRELETADGAASGVKRHGAIWGDHHRAAFLLVLASLACLAVAAYLWFTLPITIASATRVDSQGIVEAFDKATPAEALEYYEEMKRGEISAVFDPNEKPRQVMIWGIGVAVVLAAAALAGALLIVLRRTRRRAADETRP